MIDLKKYGKITRNVNTMDDYEEEMYERSGELYDAMRQDDKGKFDIVAKLSTLDIEQTTEYNEDGPELCMSFKSDWSDKAFQTGFTNNAFTQLMNKIGIPSAYAARCPHDLLRENFNHWKGEMLSKNPEQKYFIRCKSEPSDGYSTHTARAVLTERYGALDNKEVLGTFMNVMPKKELMLPEYHISSDHFNARFLNRGYDFTAVAPNGKTNKYFAGIHLINGETGNASLTLDIVIFEQWCTNGMIMRAQRIPLFSRKHVGSGYELESMLQHSLTGVGEKMENAITIFKNSKEEVVHNPTGIFKGLADRYTDIPKEEKFMLDVTRAYDRRGENNKYGIISSLTRAAQGYNYQKKLAIEVIAGLILHSKVSINTYAE